LCWLSLQVLEGLPLYGEEKLPADQIAEYLKLNAGRLEMPSSLTLLTAYVNVA
jgi:hypothetical protein